MNNPLIKYIGIRLLQASVTFMGIVTIIFFIVHLIPTDPISISTGAIMSKTLDTEVIDEVKRMYNLDKPVYVQYGLWLKRFFTLDFGTSIHDDRKVLTKIVESLPVTLGLNITSLLVAFVLSLGIGIYNAARDSSIFDRASSIVLFILYALPTPWVALLLISFFGVTLGVFPFYGLVSDSYSSLPFFAKIGDIISHLVLPLVVYTYGSLAFLTRLTRGSMLDTLSQDFIKTAYAKGLSERRVLFTHALRNSLIPIVTIFSTLLPSLIGGSVIVERIFSIPGMGLLMFNAILMFDYPVIMTVLSFSALLTLLNILVVDILYVFINPRIRYSSRGT